VAEFKQSVDTQSRWTVHGLYSFIKENSQLKDLMETARNDDMQSTQIVTMSDSGSLRAFEFTNGKMQRSKYRLNK